MSGLAIHLDFEQRFRERRGRGWYEERIVTAPTRTYLIPVPYPGMTWSVHGSHAEITWQAS